MPIGDLIMSNKIRKPKKKAQPKASYTRDNGYKYVDDVIRGVRKTLEGAAMNLRAIDAMETKLFTVSELKEIEKTTQDIRLAAPDLSRTWDVLRNNLEELTKGKKPDELDYRPLVDDAMALTFELTEKVVEPIGRIGSIIDRVSNSKGEDK